MPFAPRRPCRHPGCPELAERGKIYCQSHAQYEADAVREDRRKSASARGYDSKWREARHAYLNKHPLCAECMKKGKYVRANVVDHIIPHRGDPALFWDKNNWQPLCERCHAEKTARGL